MSFQDLNVVIYKWILEYLDSVNGAVKFSKIRADTKLKFGINNEKLIDAFNTLLEAEKIEEKKDGEDIFIIKL